MNKFMFKRGLYGLMLSLITLFMLSQISFADNINENEGKIGVGRIKISNNDNRNKSFNAAKNTAYMHIDFRVTKTTTAVDIRWTIDGPGSIEITEKVNNFKDPVTNGDLLPRLPVFCMVKAVSCCIGC